MNISDLCAVKTLNIENAMENAPEYGSGTFKKICDGIYNGTISLLTKNNGEIIGINYDSGKTGAEDSIEQKKFEREYCGIPVMTYVEKALKLYIDKVKIATICEDENEIYVIDETGERHDVYAKPKYDDYDYCDDDEDELPEEISFEDLDITEEEAISDRVLRRAIKNYTGYFVAKDAELDIEDGYVTNITYGRKASVSELD